MTRNRALFLVSGFLLNQASWGFALKMALDLCKEMTSKNQELFAITKILLNNLDEEGIQKAYAELEEYSQFKEIVENFNKES